MQQSVSSAGQVLSSLGMDTSEEEDIMELAGVDLCGVGVRRPEVLTLRCTAAICSE